AVIAFVGAIVVAARGKRLDQGAVLGMVLIPIAFNPANYYIHFICLLPLLGIGIEAARAAEAGRDDAPVPVHEAVNWLALLLVCVSQYWTPLERDTGLHFDFATALFFAGITVFLINVIRAGGPAAAAATPLTSLSDVEPTESSEVPLASAVSE